MATREERLKKLKYLQNPDLAEQEALDYLASRIETIEVEPPMPEKGVDYFTEEDINEIAEVVKGMVRDGIDGEKGEKGDKGDKGDVGERGEKGDKGADGRDGETPNIDKVIKEVISKLPKTKEVDTKAIIEQALEAFKEEYKDDGLKLTELEKRLIRLGGGGASYFSQLQDGAINNPSNGQVLTWNATTQKWENQTPTGGGGLSETFETVSANLKAYDYTINYDGNGDVTSIVYSNGVTKTLNYTSGDVTSIVLSGSTPSGISLTKTLTYTSGNVTGITYS